MKAVMISIQPKWVEKIANGQKTIEVRKTRPKLDTPFKCYIYCSFPKKPVYTLWLNRGKENRFLADGKVIGEFVCDRIESYPYDENIKIPTPMYDGDESCIECGAGYYITCGEFKKTCLTDDEFDAYGNGKTLYAWHISDLVIYDEPREIGEFQHYCNGICLDNKKGIVCEKVKRKEQEIWINCNGLLPLTRPPQSWCYVEEKE